MIQPSGHVNAPFRSFFHWKASSVTRLLHEDVGSTHATFKRRKTCKNQNAVQWTSRRIGRINTRHCSSEEMPTRIQPLSSENCAESRLPRWSQGWDKSLGREQLERKGPPVGHRCNFTHTLQPSSKNTHVIDIVDCWLLTYPNPTYHT